MNLHCLLCTLGSEKVVPEAKLFLRINNSRQRGSRSLEPLIFFHTKLIGMIAVNQERGQNEMRKKWEESEGTAQKNKEGNKLAWEARWSVVITIRPEGSGPSSSGLASG